MMGVSRSGYYKWKKRKPSEAELNRQSMLELVRTTHEQHRTHGYRWIAAYIRINNRIDISDRCVYKCFRYLGIKAETLHRSQRRQRKEHNRYPNLVYTAWDSVDRPRQVIVSDMTKIKGPSFELEVTFYFDAFTKEMLTFHVGSKKEDAAQYMAGLADVIRLLKTQGMDTKAPTILHTDQGNVYSSMAYNDLIKNENIVRSMSRAGTPTDNPVSEALNGWIKEELSMDFNIEDCRDRDEVVTALSRYQQYYNTMRPCFALDYDTPHNFYERFRKGEISNR